jgi:DNA-binding MarR family transcriptional regulator
MKKSILKRLNKNKSIGIEVLIQDLFHSIRQLEKSGFIETKRSFSGNKVDSLEITNLGREFYKEKILKK